MILADLRVGHVGDLLMVAISGRLRQKRQKRLARHSKPSYLGIVTPAFSQAWIKAEPAVVVSITISLSSTCLVPSIETFFPSELRVSPGPNREPVNSYEHLPIVSSTSAGLLRDVLNSLKP